MNIEIKENVPKPEVTRKVGRNPSYPFAKMTAGQSFALTYKSNDAAEQKKQRRNVVIAVGNFNKKHDDLDTVLSVLDLENNAGVGVWCDPKNSTEETQASA